MPQVFTQTHITALKATYLYPIKVNGDVEAIIAIDFAYNDYAAIIKAIRPMEQFFLYFSIFLLFTLVLAYFQLYLIYRGRKKNIFDPLTKAYSRMYMNEVLPKISLKSYALCMLDIDHFKHVNDTYGHGNGDKVLRELSRRIQTHVRSNDLFFRYGGEEFMLLLNKLDKAQIVIALERLRKVVKNRPIEIEHEQECLHITLSIGCNLRPEESRNIDQAIEADDKLLYQAKEEGRDRVVIN